MASLSINVPDGTLEGVGLDSTGAVLAPPAQHRKHWTTTSTSTTTTGSESDSGAEAAAVSTTMYASFGIALTTSLSPADLFSNTEVKDAICRSLLSVLGVPHFCQITGITAARRLSHRSLQTTQSMNIGYEIRYPDAASAASAAATVAAVSSSSPASSFEQALETKLTEQLSDVGGGIGVQAGSTQSDGGTLATTETTSAAESAPAPAPSDDSSDAVGRRINLIMSALPLLLLFSWF